MVRSILLVVLALIGSNASAQLWEKPATVDSVKKECAEIFGPRGGNTLHCFISHVRTSRSLCEFAAVVGDSQKCASWAEGSLKIHYDLAMPFVSGNQAGAAALKELFAYSLSTARTSAADPGELRTNYQRRMKERQQGAEDRISRLQVDYPAAAVPPPTPAQAARSKAMIACHNEASSRNLSGPSRTSFVSECLAGAQPSQGLDVACKKRADDQGLEMAVRADFLEGCLKGR